MQYRREIDGLRAVAVLPVILFHAGVPAFSGGYVGVDVFFVISGYLITSIILGELASGTFTVARFYERRIRRIVPALLLVTLLCVPAGWVWLLPPDMKEFAKSLAAVSLFVSNLFFWKTSGYFDTAAELKPLLHTWSLAVEEQFYLFFPLLLIGLHRMLPRRLPHALAALGVLSFAACWLPLFDSSARFFLLPTRAWELMAGALLAATTQGQVASAPPGQPARIVPGWMAAAGLGAIGIAVFTFDATTPVPGWPALVPTLGAVAVLGAAAPTNWVGRVLGSRMLVGIGLVSYSAYLWHQPLFAFARQAEGGQPGMPVMLALSAASLVLAACSWRWVETPLRRAPLPRPALLALPFFFALASLGFERAAHVQNGFESRFALPPAVAATLTIADPRKRCDEAGPAGSRFCWLGDNEAARPAVAVFGDSHAESLLPAFDRLGQHQHWRVVHAGLGACPPLLNVWVLGGFYPVDVCPKMAAQTLRYVQQHGIGHVYLVGRWSLYTDGDYGGHGLLALGRSPTEKPSLAGSRAAFLHGLETTVEAYRKLGVTVTLVEQVPQQRLDVKQSYYRAFERASTAPARSAILEAQAVGLNEHRALQAFNRQAIERMTQLNGVDAISLDEAFCDASRCLFGTVDESFYRDSNHLTTLGALRVESVLRQAQARPVQRPASPSK